MTKRNPFKCFLLSLITLGIYDIVWFYQTRKEMNALGAGIPAFWQAFVPFVSIVWLDRYCEGIQTITQGQIGRYSTFCILMLLGPIGGAILQYQINKYVDYPATKNAGIKLRWIVGGGILAIGISVIIATSVISMYADDQFEPSTPDDSYVTLDDKTFWDPHNFAFYANGTVTNTHSEWSIQNVTVTMDVWGSSNNSFSIAVTPIEIAPGESGTYKRLLPIIAHCQYAQASNIEWEWVSPE